MNVVFNIDGKEDSFSDMHFPSMKLLNSVHIVMNSKRKTR